MFGYLLIMLLYANTRADDLQNDNTKIIIDNDAGGDDAMAIFLALLYQKHFNGPEVIALTTVNGNTEEDNVYINNQKILKLTNRQDVHIYRGLKNSLLSTTTQRNYYYGKDGLGDTGENFVGLVPAKSQDAVSALIEFSKKYEGNLSIITIGPVTNVAVALTLDPGFLGRLKHLYIAAGHIHSDLHPSAEFNARTDAEAYYMVTQRANPDKVTVIPFSQIKMHLNFTIKWRQEVLGAIETDIIKAQNKFEQVSMKRNVRWQSLDPAAIAIMVRPDLVKEYKYSKNYINLCGENRGLNNNNMVTKEEANVRILYSVKEDEYKQFLLEVFSKQTIVCKHLALTSVFASIMISLNSVLFVLACFCCIVMGKIKEPKIVIDNDAGGDDAMAIFLALLNEKHFNGPKLIALMTVHGNTKEENVYVNNQKILKVANRQDVPIYRGSQKSLLNTPDGGNYFGFDGLGDADDEYHDLVPCKEENAVNALIELSKTHKDELTVITIGTLTNVALAIKLDPEFLGRISHLYVGAGHIHDDENTDPEFNVSMDVEAYHVITQNANPDKVTFFPFSQVKKYLNLTTAWREEVLGAIETDIMKAQNKYEQVVLKLSDRWQALDPATIAAVIKPDLVEKYQYSKCEVILCGDKRGITTNVLVPTEEANARIIYSIKEEDYKKFLLDVFSADK
ncbi:uncharacterized protein ACR2FA_005797 [Aphomia sociella]